MIHHHKDIFSILTLLTTLILFILALFAKGFTHDLLLEAGVFLVSVKLMITTSKLMSYDDLIVKKLDHLESLIKNLNEE